MVGWSRVRVTQRELFVTPRYGFPEQRGSRTSDGQRAGLAVTREFGIEFADRSSPGEEIRIPVSEEKIRVTKEAVVTEEVKVGKRVVQDIERVSGQVRKEEIKVEQSGDVDVRTRGKS